MLKKPKASQPPPITNFNSHEIKKIRKVFALFEDEHSGIIDLKAFKSELEGLQYDQTNPILFQLISNLEEEGEMDFDRFMLLITTQLGEKINEDYEETELQSRERINKLFYLWSNTEEYLNKETLVKLAEEFNVVMEERELNELIERAATNNQEITKEDFYNIMIRKQV